jgi:15-cis-phytoene synthase / lycopene beta-cyclase
MHWLTNYSYSFCRVADDLVDNCSTESEAREWIGKLTHYLDLAYVSKEARLVQKHPGVHSYITANFPKSSQSALRLLPTHLLPYGPLYELLEGFKTDLEFHENRFSKSLRTFPIANEHDLEVYATRVAGTVAELCLELVFHHTTSVTTTAQREILIRSGGRMGIALQYVNIARDIATDAAIGRVYLPTSWLKAEGLKPEDALKNPNSPAIDALRARLLDKAFGIYRDAQSGLAQLPVDARAPMRVAVESYMEIGRVLRETGYKIKKGRATVPVRRRLAVAWKALKQG